MDDSIINEKDIERIESYYLLSLKEQHNIDICLEKIEKLKGKQSWDCIDNSVGNEMLNTLKQGGTINNNLIVRLAKKYNEENNSHLIIKEEKVKPGFLNWLFKIFNANPKKEIVIDTKFYDQEEKILIRDFNNIAEKINSYLDDIKCLESIFVKEKYDDLISKVFNREEITIELEHFVEELNTYKKSFFLKQSERLNKENFIVEEPLEIAVVNCEEEQSTCEVGNGATSHSEYINENNVHNKLLVAEVFDDNIFKIFVNYCNENNIETIDQLSTFDFNELNKLKGFGVGKREKLLQRYSEVIEEGDTQEVINNEDIVDISDINIKDIYKNLDISILECFNKINGKIIEQIKSVNINTVEQLYSEIYSSKLSIPNLGATKIKYIKEALDNLEMDKEELFRYLIKEIKSNSDYDILVKRAINNNTLQQIGEEYGVSRERIRQKEKKVVNSVESILNIFIGDVDYTDVKILSMEDILEGLVVESEEKQCLKYILVNSSNGKYKYIDEIDKFLINSDIEDIKAKIVSITNGMPDIVNIKNELIYDLHEYEELSILSLDEAVTMILSLGYKKINDFLFKGTVSKTKIYNFIVKEFFKEGITFSNDDDINKFINILSEKFHIQDDSIRNIKAKIETTCVLCDRGSYIHSEWVDVDERLLDKIKDYIDNSNQETLYLNQIFAEFEKDLRGIGVDNRYYLQGILKFYYNDKYNFTKDTLYKGDIKQDRNYIFNKYIKDKKSFVSREEVENDLKGWTPIMLSMAEGECKNVLKWDKGGFIHSSLINISHEEVKEIKKYILELLNRDKESVTDNEAFDELSKQFDVLFNKNNIDTSFKLYSVLEYILSKEYYFRRPYILKDKPKEAVSAVYLMRKIFRNQEKVTLEELKEFCNDIKLNDSTRMQAINNLLRDTVEIEKETYILKENFFVDKAVVNVVKSILLNKISDKGYLALKSIEDYTDFPHINYNWNFYVLRDICEFYIPEIKELKRKFYDKRYALPIIVEDNSDMNELLDVILIILKSKFQNGVEVNELAKYLRKNCIIHDKIPFEIYNSEEIVVEDNFIMLK